MLPQITPLLRTKFCLWLAHLGLGHCDTLPDPGTLLHLWCVSLRTWKCTLPVYQCILTTTSSFCITFVFIGKQIKGLAVWVSGTAFHSWFLEWPIGMSHSLVLHVSLGWDLLQDKGLQIRWSMGKKVVLLPLTPLRHTFSWQFCTSFLMLESSMHFLESTFSSFLYSIMACLSLWVYMYVLVMWKIACTYKGILQFIFKPQNVWSVHIRHMWFLKVVYQSFHKNPLDTNSGTLFEESGFD